MKHIIAVAVVFIFTIVMIPIALGAVYSAEHRHVTEVGSYGVHDEFLVTIYRSETSTFEEIELERYLIGVVAAEMPALFHVEALRAQAVAARTYALRILAHHDYLLDTVAHQVFLDDDQLRERWGSDFDQHFATIEEAVMSTRGMVLIYEGELITPMFFAMSSGATENSEDVFASARPYLRSVASGGYEDQDNFAVEAPFELAALREAFGNTSLSLEELEILEWTEGGNVAAIQIGDEVFTGREVRETLGLRSAAFSIEKRHERIVFTTYGHGHGVGMSQTGANVMANDGDDYVAILKHFYQNAELVDKSLINVE